MAASDPKLMNAAEPSATTLIAEALKRRVLMVQDYTLLAVRSLSNVFSAPHNLADTLEQMDVIGVGSLPIVLLVGFFIGAVMEKPTSRTMGSEPTPITSICSSVSARLWGAENTLESERTASNV